MVRDGANQAVLAAMPGPGAGGIHGFLGAVFLHCAAAPALVTGTVGLVLAPLILTPFVLGGDVLAVVGATMVSAYSLIGRDFGRRLSLLTDIIPTYVTAPVLGEPIGSTVLAALVLLEGSTTLEIVGSGTTLAGLYVCSRAEVAGVAV